MSRNNETEYELQSLENASSNVKCTITDEPHYEGFKKIRAVESRECTLSTNSLSELAAGLIPLPELSINFDSDLDLDTRDDIVLNAITESETDRASESVCSQSDVEESKEVHVEVADSMKLQEEPEPQQQITVQNLEILEDIESMSVGGESLCENFSEKRVPCMDVQEENIMMCCAMTGETFDQVNASGNFEETEDVSILGEINFNYFFPEVNRNCLVSDFSNKILVVHKSFVKILKSRLSSSKGRLIFVINSSLLKQIKENTYNLDDLQYGIARAIGVEPEKIRISYFVKALKQIKPDYSHVKFGRVWEQQKRDEITYSYLTPMSYKGFYKKIEVTDSMNEKKRFNVFIDNFSSGTKWLGGYRNTETDCMYMNACTQTTPEWCRYLTSSTRNVQTMSPSRDKAVNTPCDHSTQMWRLDHYMPADGDLITNTGVYDTTSMQREKAAIIFQKYWRGYTVRKRIIPKLKRSKVEKTAIQTSAEQDVHSIKNMIEKIVLNMAYPYKKIHFMSLYWILKKRNLNLQNKLKLITMNENDKLANSGFVIDNLTKEIESLKQIEILRQAAKGNRLEKEKIKFLEQSFGPTIKKIPNKSNIYLVEEFGVENCKRLKELYVLYRREDLSPEQRLEVLVLCLQSIENCGDFEMKDDLQELLSRECILISSGVPQNYLLGLRKRGEEILYNFVNIPLRRFKTKKFLQSDFCPIIRCFYCKKYKSSQDFPVIVENKFKICKSCRFTHRTGSVTENTSSKMYHLQLLRFDEYRRGCQNPYVTLVQPSTVHDLIFNIWGGRSAIGEETFFRDLRLVRWNTREPWAPWNCILLTSNEAKEHYKIKNVYDFYSEYFCNYIKKKNLMALRKYGFLIYVEKSMRNVWSLLPDNEFKATAQNVADATDVVGETFFHPSRKSYVFS